MSLHELHAPATRRLDRASQQIGDPDCWPDDLQLVLGPAVNDILGEFVAHLGGKVVTTSPRQVAYRPSRSTTVSHLVDVEWPAGANTTETVIVTTGDKPPSGAFQLADGATTVCVWRWTDDPFLPALATALDRRRIESLFDDLGIGGGRVDLRVRAYRPGRRAVIQASNSRHTVFLKVVRPHRVEALHHIHRDLSQHLPVPDSIGWTDDGILVMPGLTGATLRDVLRHPNASPPAPAAIETLLAQLPLDVTDPAPRSTWIANAHRHARVIEATVPTARAGVNRTLERLTELNAHELDSDHPVETVHGDLYEAQLLITNGEISGLLDVDTVGPGLRINDIANFCAHLSVLATVRRPSNAIRGYGKELLSFAETRYDRLDLRTRIAAATLGLATGPFRTLETEWQANTHLRISLADQWITSIER